MVRPTRAQEAPGGPERAPGAPRSPKPPGAPNEPQGASGSSRGPNSSLVEASWGGSPGGLFPRRAQQVHFRHPKGSEMLNNMPKQLQNKLLRPSGALAETPKLEPQHHFRRRKTLVPLIWLHFLRKKKRLKQCKIRGFGLWGNAKTTYYGKR